MINSYFINQEVIPNWITLYFEELTETFPDLRKKLLDHVPQGVTVNTHKPAYILPAKLSDIPYIVLNYYVREKPHEAYIDQERLLKIFKGDNEYIEPIINYCLENGFDVFKSPEGDLDFAPNEYKEYVKS